MNRIWILIFPLLIFSCSGGEQDVEAVDYDDWAGETGLEEDTANVDIEEEVDNSFSMNILMKNMQPEYDTSAFSDFHPMDRYSFSTSSKVKFVGKNEVPYGKSAMVTPTAEFFYYSFTDSNKTINAFYNYLDIMAEDGEGGPVKLLEDVEAIKTPPMFMLVYDTVIVSARYMCEHEKNDWNSFQDSILKVYGEEFKYQIDVDCGGPLKWIQPNP